MSYRPGPKLIAGIGLVAAAAAVPLVVQHEGDVRVGYRDPIGIVTSCVGHTGPDSVLGKVYTERECAAQLESDLLEHDADMMACVRVPLTPYQRAAFLSFTFNVGATKFCGSTLARKLNAGDYHGACAELKRWTLAGGRELPGLVSRRAAEYALCMRPYTAVGTANINYGPGFA